MKRSKVLVLKNNDVLVKLGTFGGWRRVTTICEYDDGSFDICWGQDWTFYGTEAAVEVMYPNNLTEEGYEA